MAVEVVWWGVQVRAPRRAIEGQQRRHGTDARDKTRHGEAVSYVNSSIARVREARVKPISYALTRRPSTTTIF